MSPKNCMPIEQLNRITRRVEGVVAQLDCMHLQVLHLECKCQCGVLCDETLAKMLNIYVDATSLHSRQGISSSEIAELSGEKQRQQGVVNPLIAIK